VGQAGSGAAACADDQGAAVWGDVCARKGGAGAGGEGGCGWGVSMFNCALLDHQKHSSSTCQHPPNT